MIFEHQIRILQGSFDTGVITAGKFSFSITGMNILKKKITNQPTTTYKSIFKNDTLNQLSRQLLSTKNESNLIVPR